MVQHFRCKQATCQCQEIHASGKQTGRSMRTYILILIRTLISTYFIALCFAVLCSALLFSRFNDIHARTYCGTAVCCCIPGTHRSRIFVAVQIATENERQQWKIKTAAAQNARGHTCRLWPTLMLANVVIWCARKR